MQNGCCRYWFEKPPGAVTEGSVNRSEAGCGVRVGRERNGETCRGAMGIAGGLWGVKPAPFCLFLGAAEVF